MSWAVSVVPGVGLEPTRLAARVFETLVSTIPPPGRAGLAYGGNPGCSRGLEGIDGRPGGLGRKNAAMPADRDAEPKAPAPAGLR